MAARLNWKTIFLFYSLIILSVVGFLFYKVQPKMEGPDFFENRIIIVNPHLENKKRNIKVHLESENGWLKAYDEKGLSLWKFKVSLAGRGITDYLVHGRETFFVTSNGNLYKVLTETGEVFWVRMWRSRFSEILNKPLRIFRGNLVLSSDIQKVTYDTENGRVVKVEKNENIVP